MKKSVKIAGILAGVALAIPAVATYTRYCKIKEAEGKVEALPQHHGLDDAGNKKNDDNIMVHMSKSSSFIDRLAACVYLLKK